MACRSVGKANEARSALLKQTKCDPSKVGTFQCKKTLIGAYLFCVLSPPRQVIVLTLDLCDLKVVREFVEVPLIPEHSAAL
jgi:hypothetical protein